MSVAVDIPPKPGEIVRVRSRRYLVEGVDPAPQPHDQTLVHLSCLEDDAEGEELFRSLGEGTRRGADQRRELGQAK